MGESKRRKLLDPNYGKFIPMTLEDFRADLQPGVYEVMRDSQGLLVSPVPDPLDGQSLLDGCGIVGAMLTFINAMKRKGTPKEEILEALKECGRIGKAIEAQLPVGGKGFVDGETGKALIVLDAIVERVLS